MLPEWIPDVRKRLTMLQITDKGFAKECGYDTSWLSQILHGRKPATKAKDRILNTLERLENEVHGVQGDNDSDTSGDSVAVVDGEVETEEAGGPS